VIDVLFFIAINGLSKLEDHEKWGEARIMLYELWNADRDNIELLLRLFSECWYVLCEWGCIMKEDPSEYSSESPSYRVFKNTLIECATYGLTHFSRDSRFLWMAGYMISKFPYLFYDNSDLYLEWESKGLEMLALLCKQNPDDLMAKVVHLGSLPSSAANAKKEYREAKRKLTPLLDDYFAGSTAIEQYFKEVLSDPIKDCYYSSNLRVPSSGKSYGIW
jgi:hypothetical protein